MSRLAGDLRRIGRRVEAIPAELVRSARQVGPDVVEREVKSRRATMSVGSLGSLGVRSTGRTSGTTGSVELVGTGPWGLVDRGAKPHRIAAARGMPTRYGVFDRVQHPGTRGVHAWPAAEVEIDRQLGDELGALMDDATKG